MAVLKKIKFGASGTATPIAKTEVTAKSGGVMSVAAPTGVTNGIDENADYQYELDVNVDGSTIVKSNGSLAVGTVPAANVSVAAGGHNPSADPADNKTFEATTVEGVLTELNSKISASVATYTIAKETTNLDTNVKEQYKLNQTINGTTTQVGETIKIYKDSSLYSAYLGHVDDTITSTSDPTVIDGSGSEALCFIYLKTDGTYELVAVNVESFLQESEFGDGLQADSSAHVVSVKKDTSSGKVRTAAGTGDTGMSDVLTVSSSGVKVDNIQAAIDYAVGALAISAAGDNYITAAVDTNDNKKINVTADVQALTATAGTPGTYNSTTGAQTAAPTAGTLTGVADSLADGSDIATKVKTYVDGAIAIEAARGDAQNKADITAAIAGLDDTDTASAGQVVTAVSTADGIANPTKADLAGITLGGFTADATASGNIASTDTLGGALNKLSNAIAAAESAASAAHTIVDHASDNTHVTVSASQPDATTGAVTYTVTETDIASASDLGSVVSTVGLGGTAGSRSITPTTNYGNNATTVMGNMQNLDTQVKANADAIAALPTIQYGISGTELTFYGMSEYVAAP